VAMGRAIVRNPKAFLMDEPLSNLDAKLRVQMRGEITRLQQRVGITTVYVTHDQVEAMTLGDRVAVMRAGLLQQVAAPRELYTRPANAFVAGFIGSPAMSFFPATVRDGALTSALGAFPVASRFGAVADGPVLLGIRPEALVPSAVAASAGLPGIPVQARVTLVEALGSDLYVYVDVPGETDAGVAALVGQSGESGASLGRQAVARHDPASTLAPGDVAHLHLDTSAIHLFDRATGATLAGVAAAAA
jgi:multiple sugar transport system ATP-binding protein